MTIDANLGKAPQGGNIVPAEFSIANTVVDGKASQIRVFQEGDIYKSARPEVPAQLGKRYICGVAFYTAAEEGKKPSFMRYGHNGPGKDGEEKTVADLDGNTIEVYLGCGTEMLNMTGSKKVDTSQLGAPYCCNMPMTRKDPSPVPSSD